MTSILNTAERDLRRPKRVIDFSKVGGLSNNLKILRDLIILPLLHSNVYSHFNVKTPKGVLFYGPPGTGKTLVAGALAAELNKEGLGTVSFFQRKGADVLDKWFGESEKKLRTLFEKATKCRPSVIFFDELDGLAPIRSSNNDHVHCSIVTTLLALMDGLDTVLTKSWKLSPQFLTSLAESTSGFCGSDLQVLCAESLLCAMKRHPNTEMSLNTRIKIEPDQIMIEEADFLNARRNVKPSSEKLSNKMRKLNPMIQPLLQRQLDAILSRLQMLWPHFFSQFYKYLQGTERYAGRVVLVGSDRQGLNSHLVPAILQRLEHLPAQVIDSSASHERISTACQALPSILILTRIDKLWNYIDSYEQTHLAAYLNDIHAGLPILVIATCEQEPPLMLQNFFYCNTSFIKKIENPCQQEVDRFFFPLFFGCNLNCLSEIVSGLTHLAEKRQKDGQRTKMLNRIKSGRVVKRRCCLKRSKSIKMPKTFEPEIKEGDVDNLCNLNVSNEKQTPLYLILSKLLDRCLQFTFRSNTSSTNNKYSNIHLDFSKSTDLKEIKVFELWQRTTQVTAKNMTLTELEMLYDAILTCIKLHRHNFEKLVENLEQMLFDAENSK